MYLFKSQHGVENVNKYSKENLQIFIGAKIISKPKLQSGMIHTINVQNILIGNDWKLKKIGAGKAWSRSVKSTT